MARPPSGRLARVPPCRHRDQRDREYLAGHVTEPTLSSAKQQRGSEQRCRNPGLHQRRPRFQCSVPPHAERRDALDHSRPAAFAVAKEKAASGGLFFREIATAYGLTGSSSSSSSSSCMISAIASSVPPITVALNRFSPSVWVSSLPAACA